MTRHRLVTSVVGFLLGCLALGGVRPAVAGDPAYPDARAAAAAATLEAANLRAKAKIELARILDREGRTDEALAALIAADEILADAAKLAAELAAPGKPLAAPVPGRARAPDSPFRRAPLVVAPSTLPKPPRLIPRRDPVEPGLRYLLGRQGVDGSFDVTDGVNDGPERAAGRTVTVTAWALLALAEVATGDGLTEPDLLDKATAAAGRAAGFLLAGAKDDGSLAATIEDHCLAGWAAASALSRLGPRLVTAMPKEFGLTKDIVEQRLGAALRRALAAQDAVTGRLAPSGTVDEQLLAAAAFVGFLHEVEPLPLAQPFVASAVQQLETARARVAAGFATPLSAEAAPKTAAGRGVLALLRHDRTGLGASGDDGKGAADPVHLLFGTVSAFSLGSEADWEAWWQDVLVPAMNTQAFDGIQAGSFPSGPDRLGRTHATAVCLLAWLYPDMDWRAPAKD